MTGIGNDWRIMDGLATAWLASGSLTDSAALARRVLDLAPTGLVDARATGVRVRLSAPDRAESVSGEARDLGLRADPATLQHVGVVLESAEPVPLRSFWQNVLGYESADGDLIDPLRRDPDVRIRPSDEVRPLRNRFHLDVVRPAAVVEQLGLGEAGGPYGVRHADSDGNEVDLVPGDPLGDAAGTDDWQVVFGAVAAYRIGSSEERLAFAAEAAALADARGFPLMIDIRPGLVVVDSGKDQWDADAHGLDLDFAELAREIQAAARDHGAVADASAARFVQVFLDAADVDAVRDFWLAALSYVVDPRDGVSDIVDPHRLNPVMVFQALDASDTERRRQRNRTYVELAVPHDAAPTRIAAAVAAGGVVQDERPGRTRITDPEGNELVIIGEGSRN